MMLRGEQIFQSTALYGERVFFSLHALRHSGQRNHRGRLVKAKDGYVYLEGHAPIAVDLGVYDAIMSKDT